MLDVQQIISNFVPYVNPYLVISWKVPSELGPDYDVELRSEVLWDGDISFNNPVDLNASDKIRFVCDTSFTIKGWLFKTPQAKAKPIFFIDANFHAVNNKILNYNSYYSLSASDLTTDYIYLSGIPDLTNLFLGTSGISQSIWGNDYVLSNSLSSNYFILYGKNFDFTTLVLLSSNNQSTFSSTLTLTSIDATYTGTVSGYIVPTAYYEILTNGVMKLTLPPIDGTGKFDIIVNNPAGWRSSYMIDNYSFIVD